MLTGQTAVITGAGRNVGEGIANTLAENGASVVVNDIDEGRAKSVAESLPDADGQSHLGIPGDATDPDEVRALAETVREEYGGLDVLVNNLGYAENKSVFDISIDEWNRVLDLTLFSMFVNTKYLGEVMADSGGGSIINLGSLVGRRGRPDKVAYCAAKGAVLNMTRQMAIDLVEYDIRVNSVSPGRVGDPVGMESGLEERIEEAPEAIPMGRNGRPEDIGKATLFLASDLADYVTGADLPVDGGRGAE